MWIVLATVAAAADPALDALLARLTQTYGPVAVLRGTFVQTTASPYGDQTQSGTVVIKRPGRMRWDFAGDGRQFVSDGSTMWIYTPAEKQVLRLRNFGAQVASADAVLQSMDKLGTLYQVALGGGGSTASELVLTPRPGDDGQFSKLVLKLDAQLKIDEVVITDAFQTVTRLDFTTLDLGGSASDELFNFQVPAGVQVVDAGG